MGMLLVIDDHGDTREMQATATQQESNSIWVVGTAMAALLGMIALGVIFSRFGLIPDRAAPAIEGAVIVSAENLRFGQDVIRVKADSPVTLQLANADMLPHSFDVDALGWHVSMNTRETTSITFLAPAAGTYTFTCNIPGHADAGMVGKLIVEP
jgi:heme/copper-type cytochrome/quinol oxidase subunit 2